MSPSEAGAQISEAADESCALAMREDGTFWAWGTAITGGSATAPKKNGTRR